MQHPGLGRPQPSGRAFATSRRVPLFVDLALLFVAGLLVCLPGIRRDLPYTPEVDEPTFVARSVNIAATGNLNPEWFGHPASTVIYPLAAVFHGVHVAHGGALVPFDGSLVQTFAERPSDFYLAGRLVSVTFAALSIPLLYLLGARIFNRRIGMIAALLALFYAPVIDHAQMVRSDSAGLFFSVLGLWLIMRHHDHATLGSRVLAAAAVGVAISTRWHLAALLVPLLGVEMMLLWRSRPGIRSRLRAIVQPAGALAATGAAFAATTPFFVVHLPDALDSVGREGRAVHLGADGLSQTGNFIWYVTSAIPDAVSWPQAVLAAGGLLLVALWGPRKGRLAAAYAVCFLVGVSLLSLHWQRWIIPVLPVAALFGAYAAHEVATRLARTGGAPAGRRAQLVLGVLVLVMAAWPAYEAFSHNVQFFHHSTRVEAREWVLENIPSDAGIVQEWYTAPLSDTDFFTRRVTSLYTGQSLEEYHSHGYRYVMASSYIYDRYMAEAARYEVQYGFYSDLFAEAVLVKEFAPGTTRGGPVIRIYELGSASTVTDRTSR